MKNTSLSPGTTELLCVPKYSSPKYSSQQYCLSGKETPIRIMNINQSVLIS